MDSMVGRAGRHLLGISALMLCCLLMARSTSAQETVNYASLSGRVLDPQNAVVPGARVSARQTETNIVADTTTDGEGRFRFPYLKVGPYEVIIHLDGFADAKRTVSLTVGSAFDLSIALAVASLDASVTVSAEPPLLETVRSQVAATVTQTEARSLPLNGRNFLDLALLVPGVSPTNIGSTQLFAETSAVPGQGISIGSQRNLSNNFIVDGLSANDDAAGLSGITYSVDAVEQFQVVTSGGQAELGRALGGYINIVTKSGTNATHGDGYGYFRDDALNAANALTGTTLPMNQKQYGTSLGGPLLRNRTFYFVNAEQKRLEQTGVVTLSRDTVNTLNARLAAVGYPGSPLTTGTYPNPVDSTNLLGKIDHQVGGADQLGIRYSVYNVSSRNSRGAGGTNTPSAAADLDNADQSVALSNTLTLSPRTVNETRFQFASGDLKAPPTDPIGPAVSIAGVAAFGTLSGSPTRRVNRMVEVVDNISHQTGGHALRAGVDFLFNSDRITYPRSIRGSYTFSTLQNFLSGTYTNLGFTQTFGATQVAQTNPNLSIYGQDEWKVGSGLTINAGLRYDLQFLETINTDRNNIAPRVGFAWTPFTDSGTVIRGSAGLYYDRIPLRALANALLSAGNTTDLNALRQVSVSLSPAQANAPTFPQILNAPVPLVTLVNFTTMDPNIQNAYSEQGSVEIERALGEHTSYSVGYQYVRGRHLIISVNQNVPSCVAAGTNNGCRPNPNYANNSQYSSEASSNYHGLHLSFVQRPFGWGSYRVSYTLSKSMNNVGENFFSQPIDPFDINEDWGRSDDDQRHRLVATGSVNTSMDAAQTGWQRLTHGFQVSSMVQWYSALPINITSGVTTVQGTAGRPIVNGQFIPRNAGVGSDFFSLGLRVSRSFRVAGSVRAEGIAEAFNLTNRRNDLTRIGNFGGGAYPTFPAPTFNQITAVGDPRTVQLAVRFRF
jgi:carboxypeptidase family protein